MRRLRAGRTRAQAMVFMTMMLPLFLAVVGLALDGGYLFSASPTTARNSGSIMVMKTVACARPQQGPHGVLR